jgi:predicted DNA-binding transcriptional regulator AlpA
VKKTKPPSPPKLTVASTPPETHNELRLISKTEVMRRVNLSYPTIWKKMREKQFPRSRDIGGKNVWIESEVNEWIKNLRINTLKGEDGPPHSF